MFDPAHDRRRYIRSRADVEIELAHVRLALLRSERHGTGLNHWFDAAARRVIARTQGENREYAERRIRRLRSTLFDRTGRLH